MKGKKSNQILRLVICLGLTVVFIILGVGAIRNAIDCLQSWWVYDSSGKFILLWLWDKTWLLIKFTIYSTLTVVWIICPFALPWTDKKRNKKKKESK